MSHNFFLRATGTSMNAEDKEPLVYVQTKLRGL
jgi:hypothetical protein